ncbi:MAG: hypothetical protein H0X24_13390 [Ktedonobacterales bacterium]|nr:hypothetical protein [Ktedonobacterales bacterium]
MSASCNNERCWHSEDDETRIRFSIDEADDRFTDAAQRENVSLEAIGDVAARIKADGAQWRQEEYRVDSIRKRLSSAIQQERNIADFNPTLRLETKIPVFAHQGAISTPVPDPIALLTCLPPTQPRYAPTPPWQMTTWAEQTHPCLWICQPDKLWPKAVMSVVIFLGTVYALSLCISRVAMPLVISQFLSASTMTLLIIIGSIGTLLGFSMLGMSTSPGEQGYTQFERRVAQAGIFVIASSLIGIYSNVLHLDLNNLTGSLLLLGMGGVCTIVSEHLINRTTTPHLAMRLVTAGCLVCGIIFWALPLGSLL